MQGIGHVNSVCYGRKRQLDSRSVFDLHARQTQRSLDRACDGRIVEVVHGTQHPERLQQDSLTYPYVLRLEGGARTRALRLVVIDK